MFSEASGHNVVVPVAAGKCSFLVGVHKNLKRNYSNLFGKHY